MKRIFTIFMFVFIAFVCSAQPLVTPLYVDEDKIFFALYESGRFEVQISKDQYTSYIDLKSENIHFYPEWVEIYLGKMTISLVYSEKNCEYIKTVQIHDDGELVYQY